MSAQYFILTAALFAAFARGAYAEPSALPIEARFPIRSYPRAVKIKMSAFNRKPPTGNGRK